MRVFIRDNYDDLSSTAAGFICDVIKASESKESKMVNIAFPSGRSVIGLYRELGRLCGEEGGVSFKNVRAFHLDEYCGLEEEDKMCQKNWMKKNLYDKIDIDPKNVHYLNPWIGSDKYEEECSRFESLIESSGGLDFAFFGTGADGHVARNEPGSSLKSVSRVHRLAYDTIMQLKDRWGRETVPEEALTMGMETIFKAKQVLVLFAGVSRSHALERCLEEAVNHMFPVSCFQKHTNCVFLADEPATYELRVKTVSYFKGIEKTSEEVFGDPIHGKERL
ncbi:hypothetical protein TrRE_jg8500 [Triparma retinervis]|uniref:glucosamine-6-phosphate deaminase n=1 Tax=Triparma retinervis TaxID=2557542 RepID=A0A9W7C8Q6_9STRA|nr:hypothetical protein TrRE_jg8500 [Triparma retinervis]